MVRAPCCEKSGLKKGPWTAEEDRILVNFVTQNGHENWRALPKRAGLLRCGKSCRLRWMNYLRPDIKRGNFTREEEELIINLHAELGNKWSAIVARLPGRTDNEIKNVWHTHLKKRVAGKSENMIGKVESSSECDRKVENYSEEGSSDCSLSEVSSATTVSPRNLSSDDVDDYVMSELLEKLMETGDNFWPETFPVEEWSDRSDFSSANSFWSEVFAAEEWSGGSDFSTGDGDSQLQVTSSSSTLPRPTRKVDSYFWQDVFNRAEELTKYI